MGNTPGAHGQLVSALVMTSFKLSSSITASDLALFLLTYFQLIYERNIFLLHNCAPSTLHQSSTLSIPFFLSSTSF